MAVSLCRQFEFAPVSRNDGSRGEMRNAAAVEKQASAIGRFQVALSLPQANVLTGDVAVQAQSSRDLACLEERRERRQPMRWVMAGM